MKSKTFVLFMMGGSGVRFGAEKPKQFVEVSGKPVFVYPLIKYDGIASIDGVIIVCNALYIEDATKICESNNLCKIIKIVPGGDTRSESVYNGLKALDNLANDEDVILIHDATHPFVDVTNLDKLIDGIREYGAGSMVNYIYDTAYLKNDDGFLEQVIDRKKIAVGASPEGFSYSNMKNIYFNTPKEELEKMTSAGALALSFNIKMVVIEIELLNLKITYKRDMELFAKLIDYYMN